MNDMAQLYEGVSSGWYLVDFVEECSPMLNRLLGRASGSILPLSWHTGQEGDETAKVKKDKSSRKAKPNTSVNMEPAGSRQPGGHRSTLAAAAGSNKAEVMPRPGTKRSLSDRLQSKAAATSPQSKKQKMTEFTMGQSPVASLRRRAGKQPSKTSRRPRSTKAVANMTSAKAGEAAPSVLPFTSVMAGSVSHPSLKTLDVPVYKGSVKQEAPCKQGKAVEEQQPGGNSTEFLKTSNTKIAAEGLASLPLHMSRQPLSEKLQVCSLVHPFAGYVTLLTSTGTQTGMLAFGPPTPGQDPSHKKQLTSGEAAGIRRLEVCPASRSRGFAYNSMEEVGWHCWVCSKLTAELTPSTCVQDEDDAPTAVPLTSDMKGEPTHAPLSSPNVVTRKAAVRHKARTQQGTANKAAAVIKPGAVVQEGVVIKDEAIIQPTVNKEGAEEDSNNPFDAPSGMDADVAFISPMHPASAATTARTSGKENLGLHGQKNQRLVGQENHTLLASPQGMPAPIGSIGPEGTLQTASGGDLMSPTTKWLACYAASRAKRPAYNSVLGEDDHLAVSPSYVRPAKWRRTEIAPSASPAEPAAAPAAFDLPGGQAGVFTKGQSPVPTRALPTRAQKKRKAASCNQSSLKAGAAQPANAFTSVMEGVPVTGELLGILLPSAMDTQAAVAANSSTAVASQAALPTEATQPIGAEMAQQETGPVQSPQQQQAAPPTEATQLTRDEVAQQDGSAQATLQQQATPAPAAQQQQGARQAGRKAQRGKAKVVKRALGVKAGSCISKAQRRAKLTARTHLSRMVTCLRADKADMLEQQVADSKMVTRLRADKAALAEMLEQQVADKLRAEQLASLLVRQAAQYKQRLREACLDISNTFPDTDRAAQQEEGCSRQTVRPLRAHKNDGGADKAHKIAGIGENVSHVTDASVDGRPGKLSPTGFKADSDGTSSQGQHVSDAWQPSKSAAHSSKPAGKGKRCRDADAEASLPNGASNSDKRQKMGAGVTLAMAPAEDCCCSPMCQSSQAADGKSLSWAPVLASVRVFFQEQPLQHTLDEQGKAASPRVSCLKTRSAASAMRR